MSRFIFCNDSNIICNNLASFAGLGGISGAAMVTCRGLWYLCNERSGNLGLKRYMGQVSYLITSFDKMQPAASTIICTKYVNRIMVCVEAW